MSEFENSPKQVTLRSGFQELTILNKPNSAVPVIVPSGFDRSRQEGILWPGGPYFAFSRMGAIEAQKPVRNNALNKMTFVKIANVNEPGDVKPIANETGDLGLVTFACISSHGQRFLCDRWQEWKVESIRWKVFQSILWNDYLTTEPQNVAEVKIQLNELIDSLEGVTYGHGHPKFWQSTNPTFLIANLLEMSNLQLMRSHLVQHVNQLTAESLKYNHISLEMIPHGPGYGWHLFSTDTFGAAVLSAASYFGASEPTVLICEQCGNPFAKDHRITRFCSAKCRSRATSKRFLLRGDDHAEN